MADRCVTSYVKNGDEEKTFSKYCRSKEYCEYSSKATCKAAETSASANARLLLVEANCNVGFAAPKISGVVMLTCVLTLSHITDVFKFVTDFTVYHWVF